MEKKIKEEMRIKKELKFKTETLRHMKTTRKSDLATKQIPYKKCKALFPQLSKFIKSQANHMLMDVNSLETMFNEFSKFHQTKETQKEFWKEKVGVKQAEKLINDEDEVRQLIGIEKDYRDLQKDNIVAKKQYMVMEYKKQKEEIYNEQAEIENEFIDKVKIINQELYKLQKAAPYVKTFEQFMDLYLSSK